MKNKKLVNITKDIKIDENNNLIFDGFKYKLNNRDNKYNKIKGNNNIFIYKCIFQRYNEPERINQKLGAFCNATIKCEIKNNEYIYYLIKEHSNECLSLKLYKNINVEHSIDEYELFKKQCINILDNANSFDRKLFREQFKDIYNSQNFKFDINDYKLNNIITNWQNNTIKFKKYSIFEHNTDNKGRPYLREYREFYYNESKKKIYKNMSI